MLQHLIKINIHLPKIKRRMLGSHLFYFIDGLFANEIITILIDDSIQQINYASRCSVRGSPQSLQTCIMQRISHQIFTFAAFIVTIRYIAHDNKNFHSDRFQLALIKLFCHIYIQYEINYFCTAAKIHSIAIHVRVSRAVRHSLPCFPYSWKE